MMAACYKVNVQVVMLLREGAKGLMPGNHREKYFRSIDD